MPASTLWSALAWQRFGPTTNRLNAPPASAKAAPGRRTPKS
ncbi:MAG TPA: hypothetical protein VHR36_11055 [Pyrinomonadaceae bacterium]|nr:hypothetical protein [Pyrinomonadaceae bacterium]